MKPLISILLPHLRNPYNDAALDIALSCIVANTDIDYEVIIEAVSERRDIYGVINSMAARCNSEWIVPTNTDVFMAAGWASALYDARAHDVIAAPIMVECGAIPVNDRNLERDFGRTPQTFRRAEFEAWTADGGGWREHWREDEQSWYFPSLFSRERFLDLGGFDTGRGSFPLDPLDIYFWDTWAANGGSFRRVRTFVYHLQAYSEEGRGVR
jgi:hypothetical protein